MPAKHLLLGLLGERLKTALTPFQFPEFVKRMEEEVPFPVEVPDRFKTNEELKACGLPLQELVSIMLVD